MGRRRRRGQAPSGVVTRPAAPVAVAPIGAHVQVADAALDVPLDSPQPIVIHPPVHGAVDLVGPMRPTGRAEPRADARTGARNRSATRASTSPAPPELATARPRRAFSLDALRGLFLVAMTVGFTVRGVDLPLWMYHRQMPPPDFSPVEVAGIAWRDLTYVAFLFTMAAALPITLARRVERGEPELAIVFAAVKRFVLLLAFALLIGHSNTYFTGYTQASRGIAIAGFAIMALVFTRPRPDWNQPLWKTLRAIGWGLAVAFLALSPLAYGETFSFTRIDDIISGLAFAALAGSVIWYFTREAPVARLAILGVAVALYLGSRREGWIQDWWWSSPVPWALAPSRLGLLCIVIPGTFAGDAILRWTRSTTEARPRWGGGRLALIALLTAAVAPVFTIGMYTRNVALATLVLAGMVVVGLVLVAKPHTPLERMLQSLFHWGAAWLLIGLFLEPAEGGIRKSPETLSYFFGVTGVSVMLLVALTTVVDALRQQRWLAPLIDVGHNPMLCYVLYTVLINSAFELVPPLRGVLRQSAGEVVLRMLIEVALVIMITRFFSRRRIFWRT